ncbi:MAG: leucine-rich repeat domain-containing protein [Holosporaceae bacterium]
MLNSLKPIFLLLTLLCGPLLYSVVPSASTEAAAEPPNIEITTLHSTGKKSVTVIGTNFDLNDWHIIDAKLHAAGASGDDVQDLELQLCRLQEVPAWVVEKLPNLVYLNLMNNHLTKLPDNIHLLKNLETLDVRMNQLTDLPANLEHLTKLTDLNLSDNKLKNLPSVLGELTNLETLVLSDNQLGMLPGSIGQLSALESLSLRHNPLAQKGSGDKWGKKELKRRFGDKVRF